MQTVHVGNSWQEAGIGKTVGQSERTNTQSGAVPPPDQEVPSIGSISLGLILGSTREGRFGERIAKWAAGVMAQDDRFEVDLIDPARMDLPDRHGREVCEAIRTLHSRLASAEAFVVVTPEYNHGYPAALKFLIDSAKAEWQAKPVAFVSYGGISGGLRAVEQLRLVFAELHAVTIRDTVSFTNPWHRFDDTGALAEGEEAAVAMRVMLNNLAWWADALRRARLRIPYGHWPA